MPEEAIMNFPRFSISLKQLAKNGTWIAEVKCRAESSDDIEMFLNEATEIVLKKLEELNKH